MAKSRIITTGDLYGIKREEKKKSKKILTTKDLPLILPHQEISEKLTSSEAITTKEKEENEKE